MFILVGFCDAHPGKGMTPYVGIEKGASDIETANGSTIYCILFIDKEKT